MRQRHFFHPSTNLIHHAQLSSHANSFALHMACLPPMPSCLHSSFLPSRENAQRSWTRARVNEKSRRRPLVKAKNCATANVEIPPPPPNFPVTFHITFCSRKITCFPNKPREKRKSLLKHIGNSLELDLLLTPVKSGENDAPETDSPILEQPPQ